MEARWGKSKRERCGGLEEGKTEGVSHLAFPFCVFAAPPPALPVLATQARKKQENNGVIYGNLAVLSNPALTGELHWLNMRLTSARTNSQGLKIIEEDALPLIGHLQMVYILQFILDKDQNP